MVKRLTVLLAVLMSVVMMATTSGYAAPKAQLPSMASEKARVRAIQATLGADDFQTVALGMRREGLALDTKGAIVTEAGKSPSGNPVYTVAMGELTSSRNKNHAVLAFVEETPEGVVVRAVGRLSLSVQDQKGHRTLTISGPRHATVRSVLDGETGQIISTTVEGRTLETSGTTLNSPDVAPADVGDWLCWLAETVACSAICIPLGFLGLWPGIVCGVVCSAVFQWVCSYA